MDATLRMLKLCAKTRQTFCTHLEFARKPDHAFIGTFNANRTKKSYYVICIGMYV